LVALLRTRASFLPLLESDPSTMPLAPELVSIAERLLASMLDKRNERLHAELYRRQDDAVRGGRQGMGYYAQEQKDSCVREIKERIDAIWLAYRQVITDASVPWTDDLRHDVLERIRALIEQDVPYVEEMARSVIVLYGHGFEVFLHDAKKGMLERITAEIDLFGVKHRPIGAGVILQLQAQPYSGPRQHWIEAQAALRSSPPRFTHAAREAVHAVEGMAKIVAESPNDTLGGCIAVLRKRGVLDAPTAKTLDALWGLVNTIQGIRHGAREVQYLTQARAEHIVGLAEAALKLLLSLDAPRN